MATTAKILVLDIETAPAVAYVWGLRDQNIGIEQIKYDAYCLMWAGKFLGESEIQHDALPLHTEYFRKHSRCDRQIAKTLQGIMNKADIIVTQNGDHFDLKWANQLFLKHDLEQPKKYYSVDLLKESRKAYYSISHRLDFRGRQLAIGSKKPHEGFKLWLKCMDGDKAAWNRMIEYCRQDIVLTEKYYKKLRARIKNHPNVNMFHQQKPFTGRLKCPVCGSANINKAGFNFYSGGRRQRFQCVNCRHRMTLAGKFDPTTKVVFKSE